MATTKYAKMCYITLMMLVVCSLFEDFNLIDLAFVIFMVYVLIRYIYINNKY